MKQYIKIPLLPFLIVRKTVWDGKHEYRLHLENELDRVKGELATKTNVLKAVETAVPIIKDQAVRKGVEAGKTYMKRELIRHARTKRQ